jgi:hypothetical protein
MSTDLKREQLLYTLAASTCWTGADEPPDLGVPQALAWLRARFEVGEDHLPFVLVHDLGHLLLRGRDFRFSSGRQLSSWGEEERAIRLRYEDEVLGRWAVDPSVREAHIALAGLPDAIRDRSIAHAVALAVSGPLMSVEGLARANPAHLRDLIEKAPDALVKLPIDFEARREAIADKWRDFVRDQLTRALAALPRRRVFTDEDIWEISHLDALPSDSARLSLREVHRAQRRVGAADPTQLLSLKRRVREVPMEDTESDRYPTGGFDAVSTKGSFENLVRSEIAYVGEAADILDGIDLFDLRFVESELLFYTRDESPLLDQRRELTFVIERPSELRTKERTLSAQSLVLVHALILAMQKDVTRAFGTRGSHATIAYLVASEEDAKAAAEETGLLSLTLEAELNHRRVDIVTARSWDEVPTKRRIVFSPLTEESRAEARAWIQTQGATWHALDDDIDASKRDALRELATNVLVAGLS